MAQRSLVAGEVARRLACPHDHDCVIALHRPHLVPFPRAPPQSASLNGVHDGWSFDDRVVLPGEDAAVWMTHALVDLFPRLVPSWSPSDLLARERLQRGWTVEDQAAHVARVREAGNWAGWLAAWEAWWKVRAADGSSASDVAGAVPTVADIPTIASPLVVAVAADPGPSDAWTPLKLSTLLWCVRV